MIVSCLLIVQRPLDECPPSVGRLSNGFWTFVYRLMDDECYVVGKGISARGNDFVSLCGRAIILAG